MATTRAEVAPRLPELEVLAEHRDQMLLEPHHQRMDPGVEDHVRPFPPHLRAIPRGDVLHMEGAGDHRAGDVQALGDVPLHLRPEHKLGRGGGDRLLHREIVVADQRLEAIRLRRLAHLTRHLARIGPDPHDLEAEFVAGDAGRRDRVRGIAEDEDPLPGEVGGVH